MVTKNCRERKFGKKYHITLGIKGVKNLIENALSCTISEINVILHYTQKFKLLKIVKSNVCKKIAR